MASPMPRDAPVRIMTFSAAIVVVVDMPCGATMYNPRDCTYNSVSLRENCEVPGGSLPRGGAGSVLQGATGNLSELRTSSIRGP